MVKKSCLPGRDMTRIWLAMLILLMSQVLAGTAWSERMFVNSGKANIRSGPGTDKYDVLWEVERYYPVEVVRKQGGWVYFRDFEGDEGWIHGKLLGKGATVITLTDMVNIRSGPGTQHDIIFKAERGVPFKVLERQGDWTHIQSADDDKGWIHNKLVW